MVTENEKDISHGKVSTHIETIFFYPICLAVGLFFNPKATVQALLKEGFKPSYRQLYKNLGT